MPLKYSIRYKSATAPIIEPVTKFGGQPVWIEEPQWPLSRKYGMAMQFICQIVLTADLFGDIEPRMAYLFITDWDFEGVPPDTPEPDGGENAVILQPGGVWQGPSLPLREGPTLYQRACEDGRWVHSPVELEVQLLAGNDPHEDAWDHQRRSSAFDAYFEALCEDKIGGTPVPTINCGPKELAGPGDWRLLLQLNTKGEDESDLFFLNFATDGVGWALISEDGRLGKFMWSR